MRYAIEVQCECTGQWWTVVAAFHVFFFHTPNVLKIPAEKPPALSMTTDLWLTTTRCPRFYHCLFTYKYYNVEKYRKGLWTWQKGSFFRTPPFIPRSARRQQHDLNNAIAIPCTPHITIIYIYIIAIEPGKWSKILVLL